MITIYTKPGCVACKEAKRYLTEKGENFTEIDLAVPETRTEFTAAYPRITQAPAIFEDGEYIGSYTELRERYSGRTTQLLEE